MSDEEEHSWSFYRVYITTPGLSRDTVFEALCHDPQQQYPDSVLIETRLGQTTQELIRHHRDTTRRGTDTHPRYFLVFDSVDLQHRGIMLVSLDEYHGYNDALRYDVDEGRDSLNSLDIANDDWFTCRASYPLQKPPFVMRTRGFALYNLFPEGREEEYEKARAHMNQGLQEVGLSEQEDEDEGMGEVDVDDEEEQEEEEGSIGSPITIEDALGGEGDDGSDGEEMDVDEGEPEEGWDEIYKAASADDRDLADVMAGHASYAREKALEPGYFAVADVEFETRGPLIVRVAPHSDAESFRCRGEVAGEILRWVFIGLMTWEEARDFSAATP